MKLYLVQHGKAKSKQEDPERRLTEEGKTGTHKVASYTTQNINTNIDKIFHSGKARAMETAEIMTEYIKPANGVEKTGNLAPMDDPAIQAENIKTIEKDIMLVGHLPYMSKMASLLLCGDQDKKTISFKNSGIICLERDEGGEWAVEWILAPQII